MGTEKPTNSISPVMVHKDRDRLMIVDVRKPRARTVSGLAIAGSRSCHPFDALNWKEELRGRLVVVYCVHGHEVSQAVCGFLRDEGIDALYLEGGFEAWRDAGYTLEPVAGTER